MEFRQLQCFLAVAEALNFRRAAERLRVSQPSISRQVRQLEEELGTVLFLRDRQQVQLTASGRLALAKAKVLMEEIAGFAQSVNVSDPEGCASLKVGVGIPLAKSIRRVVTEYAREFPRIDVQYQDIVYASMQNKALRKGDIDVGIFWPPIDHLRIDSERLFDKRFRVILPKSSPLAKRKKLRIKELEGQSLLLPDQTRSSNRKVLQLCREAHVNLKPVHTTALPHEAGAALVASGKGIYVLAGSPLLFPNFGVGIASIALDEPLSLEVHLAWRKGETSVAVLHFLEIARRVFHPASGLVS